MAAFAVIEFEGGRQSWPMTTSHFYVLEEGETLRVWSCEGWCGTCQMFREVERVPTREVVEEGIRELESYAARPGLIPPGRPVRVEELPEMRRRLEWVGKRVGPARCLECGSERVLGIAPGDGTVVPGLGRCKVSYLIGDSSVREQRSVRYYSPEGITLTPGPSGPPAGGRCRGGSPP